MGLWHGLQVRQGVPRSDRRAVWCPQQAHSRKSGRSQRQAGVSCTAAQERRGKVGHLGPQNLTWHLDIPGTVKEPHTKGPARRTACRIRSQWPTVLQASLGV